MFKWFRPVVSHREPKSLPDGLRAYAVGDIHGRLDLLSRLLALIDADIENPDNARIIFLGDYIDRGTESQQVIEMMLRYQRERGAVCLRGNHEAMLLGALEGQMDWDFWLSNGGTETLFSYGINSRALAGADRDERLSEAVMQAMPVEHLAFFSNLPFSTALGDYFFCHAGVRPGTALGEQSPQDLMWIREPFLHSTEDYGKRIVHGHTPVMEVDIRPNRINVDTGGYLTNRLSCVVLEGTSVRVLHT